MSAINISVSGTVHSIVVDGVTYVPSGQVPAPQPPNPTPTPPNPTPTPPTGGNPSAIVPSWGQWNAAYPGGFYLASGQVAAFPVVTAEGNPDNVKFTMGQMPVSPPNCDVEFCLSRTPGVIDTSDTTRYQKQRFSNHISLAVWMRASGWDMENRMHAYPEAGPWYLNVRWTYPYPPSGVNPGAHSVQWAY